MIKNLGPLAILALLTLQAADAATSTTTQFTAHLDSYQVVPGYSAPETADFTITLESSGNAMRFALTPHNNSTAISQVWLGIGQTFTMGGGGGGIGYNLCGQGNYSPRPSCAQSYYGQNYSSGELVPSDLLPYGSYTNLTLWLDLLRHNLGLIVVQFANGNQIRGQLQ